MILELKKRFKGAKLDINFNTKRILSLFFYQPTTKSDFFDVELGQYFCIIKEEGYLVSVYKKEHIEFNACEYVEDLSNPGRATSYYFQEGVRIRNLQMIRNDITSQMVTKLNPLQTLHYTGLLRANYIDLEERTVGLYLIKN